MSNSNILFVYGTLRKGQAAHSILSNSKYLGEYKIPPTRGWALIDLGAYPGMVPSYLWDVKGCYVHGELYEVDDATYDRVETYEGYPHLYTRYIFILPKNHKTLPGREIQFYVYNTSYHKPTVRCVITSGDWNKYLEEKLHVG